MSGTTFTANHAEIGGGVRVAHRTASEFSQCSVRGNTSSNSGGGVSFYHADTGAMTDCSVVENKTAGSLGGGLRLAFATVRATRCEVSGNTGSAAALLESSLTIDDCTISGNAPFAFMAQTAKETIAATKNRFGANGDALYRIEPSNRTFATVERMAMAFPTWKDNVSIASLNGEPAEMAIAVGDGYDMENAAILDGGIYVVCVAIAVVFLIGGSAVLFRGRLLKPAAQRSQETLLDGRNQSVP
jgi:hypothetical protein